jgi:preprotein translocase subunit SecF
MQWLSGAPNFPFMRYRRLAMFASILVTAASLVSLATRGLNFGIDFTGGVILEVAYPKAVDLPKLRADLATAGFTTAQVQNFGSASDVLIRLPPLPPKADPQAMQTQIMDILRMQSQDVKLQRNENVGRQVGADFAQRGALAVVIALMLTFVYVALRFRMKLAAGAIVATAHDVLTTVGFFSVFGLQFDLTVLGSVLAVLGWSLNDTVVIYDRIRDNFRLMRRSDPVAIVNTSVNQTLSRTLMTGGTTLLVVLALLFLGGDSLWGFSMALVVGIIVGTYSSTYVASSMALALKVAPADLMPAKQERVDELP